MLYHRVVTKYVSGIKDENDDKGGIWDHAEPRDGPDWDQQFLEGTGIRKTVPFLSGIKDQTLSWFWNQGSELWVQKRDQR